MAQVPLVDYLVLEPEPHLVAHECTSCGARFFDRRNACAGCFGTEFRTAEVATAGEVRAFTIVSLAAPGIPVPFVAALVDCEGTSVRSRRLRSRSGLARRSSSSIWRRSKATNTGHSRR